MKYYSHMIVHDFKTTFNPLWTGYGWGAATREPRVRAELKYILLFSDQSVPSEKPTREHKN